MKAVSPVRHPSRKALTSGCCCGDGGGGDLALRCLAEHGCYKGSPSLGEEEPAALCLQCDMNDCYSRLRKLVPTIPPNKRVSKVEILQHVIDYILDLQLALETHPALLRPSPPPPPPLHPASYPGGPPRTPLTALNTDPEPEEVTTPAALNLDFPVQFPNLNDLNDLVKLASGGCC